MKKYAVLSIIILCFAFILSGCTKSYSYEENTFEEIVTKCEKGTYHPDASYRALANMYLAQKKMGMWSMYMNLANSNGTYDYQITINVDGNNYTIIRKDPYDVGAFITITEIKTYQNAKLVKTEYK